MIDEIEKRLSEISFVEKYSKTEYKRKFNEVFINALASNTKDYIMKRNLKEVDEISKILIDLERELIEGIKE